MRSSRTIRSVTIMIVGFLAFIMLSSPAYSGFDKPMYIPGIRPLGMGGAFLALADDQNAFFYNPAGITQRVNTSISFLETGFSVNSTTYGLGESIIAAFTGAGLSLDDPLSMLDQITSTYLNRTFRIYAAMPTNVSIISPPMGYFSAGIGIFLGSLNMETSIKSAGIIPVMTGSIIQDSAIIVPLAYEIGSNIVIGASAKAINRNKISLENYSLLDLLGIGGSGSITLPNAVAGWGYGVDAGMLIRLGDQLTLGATYKDIGGTTINYAYEVDFPFRIIPVEEEIEAGYIPERINLGMAYVFSSEQLPMGENATFTLQYDDLMGHMAVTDRGAIKLRLMNIHAGMEMAWNMMSLRVGLNQGYATIGVGLYLGPVNIDYSYFGEELGAYAGAVSQFNHFFTFAVRFN